MLIVLFEFLFIYSFCLHLCSRTRPSNIQFEIQPLPTFQIAKFNWERTPLRTPLSISNLFLPSQIQLDHTSATFQKYCCCISPSFQPHFRNISPAVKQYFRIITSKKHTLNHISSTSQRHYYYSLNQNSSSSIETSLAKLNIEVNKLNKTKESSALCCTLLKSAQFCFHLKINETMIYNNKVA